MSSVSDEAAKRAAKTRLRARIRAVRRTLDPDVRAANDTARDLHLLDFAPSYWRIAVYVSVPPEPGTHRLIADLSLAGHPLLLPVLGAAGPHWPDWAWYDGPDRMRPGMRVSQGTVLEPATPHRGAPALALADLILVPALAVSEVGARLGTGGGWYDRALAHRRPDVPLVALVGDDEVLPDLPVEPHDRGVEYAATPAGVLSLRPRGSE